MVAVVFVGPVGGVDDVGIRGGGRQRMIFDIELNGLAWGLQPEDLQVDVQKFAKQVSVSLCRWTHSITVACLG